VGENNQWTILLDLDDTLIASTHLYHAPSIRCGAIITAALAERSIHPADLFQMHLEIDMAMVKTHGYGLDRYPQSWVRTYEKLSRQVKLPIDRKVCDRLAKAARAFARGPYVPIEGAKEALVELQRQGHSLHLITAGDKGLQEKKVRLSGLSALFDSVNVTGPDKLPAMTKITADRKDRTLMAGDSLRSDIKPAIELGIVAVHVPSRTWAFANQELDRRRYRTIKSVRELPALVRSLEKRRTRTPKRAAKSA